MSSARKRGDTWTAYWFIRDADGNRVQRTKGGFALKRDALAHAGDQEGKIRAGTYSEPEDKKITVGRFLDEVWLPAMRTTSTRSGAPRSENTLSTYETAVRAWIKPHIGGERLLALTPRQIERMCAELRAGGGKKGKPLGARGVQVAFIVLRTSLEWAVRRGYLQRNPAALMDRPGVDKREMATWNGAEAQAFLAHAAKPDPESPTPDRLYAAWVLLLTRGLRRGELAGLRWDRVDLDAGRLQVTRTRVSVSGRVVERTTTKTAAGRRSIPLDPGLVSVLRAHRERQLFEQRSWGESWQDSGYVFVREDGSPYHPESISQRFDRLCGRAEVRRIRLHDLRHTAATLMLEDGTPVKVAAEMLGHSNPAVTQATYQHVLPGMAEAAGERLSGRLLGSAS